MTGHGPSGDGWDAWACDFPEGRPPALRVRGRSSSCLACLVARCAFVYNHGDYQTEVSGELAAALGVAEGTVVWFSELLPTLAEYHNLPLRALIPHGTNR